MDLSSDTDDGVCVVRTGNGEDDIELIDLGDINPCDIRLDDKDDETNKDEYDELVLPDFTRI
jgi:hypothetical protein